MTKEEKSNPKIQCKTCIHWKSEQSLLNYCHLIGFCVNPKFKFNTSIGRLVGVYDDGNVKNVSGNPSHDFEATKEMAIGVDKSIYHLVTEETFGCIFHKNRKP